MWIELIEKSGLKSVKCAEWKVECDGDDVIMEWKCGVYDCLLYFALSYWKEFRAKKEAKILPENSKRPTHTHTRLKIKIR